MNSSSSSITSSKTNNSSNNNVSNLTNNTNTPAHPATVVKINDSAYKLNLEGATLNSNPNATSSAMKNQSSVGRKRVDDQIYLEFNLRNVLLLFTGILGLYMTLGSCLCCLAVIFVGKNKENKVGPKIDEKEENFILKKRQDAYVVDKEVERTVEETENEALGTVEIYSEPGEPKVVGQIFYVQPQQSDLKREQKSAKSRFERPTSCGVPRTGSDVTKDQMPDIQNI